jgi:hypothetical protein
MMNSSEQLQKIAYAHTNGRDAPLADMPCKREPHARGADREWHGIDHPFYVLYPSA